MDDLENIQTDETVEDTVEESQVEETVSDSEGLEDEERKSTISKIADILRGRNKVENDDDSDDNDLQEDSESEDVEESEDYDYEEIDPSFVAAARSYGWDDNRIIEYAEEHDDRDLVLLTGMMTSQIRDVQPEDEVKLGKESDDPFDGVLAKLESEESVGDLTKQVLKALASELKGTREQVSKLESATESQREASAMNEWADRLYQADDMFDAAAEDFPELGITDELKHLPNGELDPRDPRVEARDHVFQEARMLFEAGKSWNEALRFAMQWYRGGRSDVVEDKVLKNIKANSKRITPRRDSRHQVKKYRNDIEEKADVVNEVFRKYGQPELPE